MASHCPESCLLPSIPPVRAWRARRARSCPASTRFPCCCSSALCTPYPSRRTHPTPSTPPATTARVRDEPPALRGSREAPRAAGLHELCGAVARLVPTANTHRGPRCRRPTPFALPGPRHCRYRRRLLTRRRHCQAHSVLRAAPRRRQPPGHPRLTGIARNRLTRRRLPASACCVLGCSQRNSVHRVAL